MTRVTRLIGGSFAAMLIAPWIGGVVANASSATPIDSGDPRAVASSGNVTTCADINLAQDDPAPGADNGNGLNADGLVVTNDGTYVDVTALPDGVTVDAFVVKGGDEYNLYPGSLFTSVPVNDMHAPLNPNGKPAGVSHWFICYGPAGEQPPPDVTPPSATITGGCDSADVELNAGTDLTNFVVTRAGDQSGTTYPVDGGQTLGVPVSLDKDHPSVTVTVDGQTLKTFSRDSDICDRSDDGGGDQGGGGGDQGGGGGDQGGGNGAGGSGTGATVTNPATSASNACKSGITVTLSNLGATVPVTFTLTAPDGSTSTVAVGANESTTRSFAIAEDTTGTVTVTAPGLAAKTFEYDKDCVTVLGVKHVKHARHHKKTQGERTKVLGNGASQAQLPFTGFDARGGLLDAGLTIGLGLALCVGAARRREQPAPERRRR